jgi:AcrR family transcriptional regulator
MLKSKVNVQEKRGQDTKERIIAAAIDLFSQEGYTGASIRDITGAVGIKESSLYHYFSSKQEIIEIIYASFKNALALERQAHESIPTVIKPYDSYLLLQNNLIFLKKMFDKPFMRKVYRVISMERYRDKQAFEIMSYDIYQSIAATHEIMFKKMIAAGIMKPLLDPDILSIEYTYAVMGIFGDYNILKYYEKSTTAIEDLMFEYVKFFWDRVKNI